VNVSRHCVVLFFFAVGVEGFLLLLEGYMSCCFPVNRDVLFWWGYYFCMEENRSVPVRSVFACILVRIPGSFPARKGVIKKRGDEGLPPSESTGDSRESKEKEKECKEMAMRDGVMRKEEWRREKWKEKEGRRERRTAPRAHRANTLTVSSQGGELDGKRPLDSFFLSFFLSFSLCSPFAVDVDVS